MQACQQASQMNVTTTPRPHTRSRRGIQFLGWGLGALSVGDDAEDGHFGIDDGGEFAVELVCHGFTEMKVGASFTPAAPACSGQG